jgi:transcriptional regulator of acetoin/glycerol metabolism
MGTKDLTVSKILAALELSSGSITGAAKVLGVSRQTVHAKMRLYGITVNRLPTHQGDLPGDGSAA